MRHNVTLDPGDYYSWDTGECLKFGISLEKRDLAWEPPAYAVKAQNPVIEMPVPRVIPALFGTAGEAIDGCNPARQTCIDGNEALLIANILLIPFISIDKFPDKWWKRYPEFGRALSLAEEYYVTDGDFEGAIKQYKFLLANNDKFLPQPIKMYVWVRLADLFDALNHRIRLFEALTFITHIEPGEKDIYKIATSAIAGIEILLGRYKNINPEMLRLIVDEARTAENIRYAFDKFTEIGSVEEAAICAKYHALIGVVDNVSAINYLNKIPEQYISDKRLFSFLWEAGKTPERTFIERFGLHAWNVFLQVNDSDIESKGSDKVALRYLILAEIYGTSRIVDLISQVNRKLAGGVQTAIMWENRLATTKPFGDYSRVESFYDGSFKELVSLDRELGRTSSWPDLPDLTNLYQQQKKAGERLAIDETKDAREFVISKEAVNLAMKVFKPYGARNPERVRQFLREISGGDPLVQKEILQQIAAGKGPYFDAIRRQIPTIPLSLMREQLGKVAAGIRNDERRRDRDRFK